MTSNPRSLVMGCEPLASCGKTTPLCSHKLNLLNYIWCQKRVSGIRQPPNDIRRQGHKVGLVATQPTNDLDGTVTVPRKKSSIVRRGNFNKIIVQWRNRRTVNIVNKKITRSELLKARSGNRPPCRVPCTWHALKRVGCRCKMSA